MGSYFHSHELFTRGLVPGRIVKQVRFTSRLSCVLLIWPSSFTSLSQLIFFFFQSNSSDLTLDHPSYSPINRFLVAFKVGDYVTPGVKSICFKEVTQELYKWPYLPLSWEGYVLLLRSAGKFSPYFLLHLTHPQLTKQVWACEMSLTPPIPRTM